METEWNVVDMEGNTVPVDLSSSPDNAAPTIVVARHPPAERSVREQANDIMMMLESAMEKVCVWDDRVEAQCLEMAEHDVAVWKRRFKNCEESLKRKTAALSEAEEGQRSGKGHRVSEGTSGTGRETEETYRRGQPS
jgi:uncharacterized protein (DUF2461 family)